MACADFFQPYIAWLEAPAAQPNMINVLKFQLSGHIQHPYPGIISASGSLTYDSYYPDILLATRCLFVTIGNKKGEFLFNEETVRIYFPDGPLDRLEEATSQTIERYTAFECLGNGVIVCSNRRDTLFVTFTEGTEPAPIP